MAFRDPHRERCDTVDGPTVEHLPTYRLTRRFTTTLPLKRGSLPPHPHGLPPTRTLARRLTLPHYRTLHHCCIPLIAPTPYMIVIIGLTLLPPPNASSAYPRFTQWDYTNFPTSNLLTL